MAVDDWYLTPQVQAARTELLAAHHRLREALPLGHSHPDFLTVLTRAKHADEAYFALFPGHAGEGGGSPEDPAWAATDAAASKLEGFTAGDPSD
ncbi:MAG TPA: hypothetical protein VHZ96_08545 [Frankiaceae bacterium]|nr:hypothetical protein [Frankiaceae bacterium]